jgi:TRAP transporter 4TM/12TM fusion protein
MTSATEVTRYRVLSPFPRYIAILLTATATAVAVIYLFHLGVGLWGEVVVGTGYLFLILALLLPVAFLYFPANPRLRHKLPWYDILLSILCFAIPFWFFLHAWDILLKGWEVFPPREAFIMGLILWALVLEAARRTVGRILAILVLFFSVYPLFAEFMPGLLMARSFPLTRVVGFLIMGPEGVIGIPIKVVATLLIGFLVFGVALTNTGAGKFFLNMALSLLGMVRGGTAKVAVVSSAMVGSISGSVVTNVITTGSFTIPAMKKTGYPPHYAGAIEACASTGGVLMPPIMGAAAFIMAAFLGIPYATVALAAVIPSLLYYLGLFIQVDGYAAKTGLKGLPREELPSLRQTIKEGWFYIFAFALLIWVLFFLRREAQAPFYAAAALIVLAMFRKETRLGFKGFLNFFEDTGRVLGEITAILAAIGLLIGSLFLTGTAQTLSSEIIGLAGGNLILLVGLGAITSFILGMGLTISACYILLAVLLAPALVQGGLHPLAVHLFLLYCGMLSFITPPVAIGAFVAASLAEANPMRVGFQAIRLGAIIFLIPFLFVFEPAFVLQGTPLEIIFVVGTGALGVILLASGIEGYLVGLGRLGLLDRILSLLSGFLLFIPNWITAIAGASILLILWRIPLSKVFLSKASLRQKRRGLKKGEI